MILCSGCHCHVRTDDGDNCPFCGTRLLPRAPLAARPQRRRGRLLAAGLVAGVAVMGSGLGCAYGLEPSDDGGAGGDGGSASSSSSSAQGGAGGTANGGAGGTAQGGNGGTAQGGSGGTAQGGSGGTAQGGNGGSGG